jgi:nucleotide-binding universal stress UspA family protein
VSLAVLIAYDGSPAAGVAVRAAAALFAGAEARVVFVHDPPAGVDLSPAVADRLRPGLDRLERETSEAALEVASEGARLSAGAGMPAEPAITRAASHPWEPILSAAHDHAADVIVCGTRGRGGVARSLLGSTSASLLHHLDVPLLVVPVGADGPTGPAVLAYDGSDAARHAIATAGRLMPGRRAIVVHVWESRIRHTLRGQALGAAPLPEVREMVEDVETALSDLAGQTVAEGVALARNAGLEAAGESLESPEHLWRPIAATASARQAGVIVAGSRGRGKVSSALLGSVCSGLVHHAELPTLVVPPPEPLDARPGAAPA